MGAKPIFDLNTQFVESEFCPLCREQLSYRGDVPFCRDCQFEAEEDPIGPARGIILGLALSIPIWALIYFFFG